MIKKKIAFIIGITGQDGSYLSNLLLKKKYHVVGFTRSVKKKNLLKLKKVNNINNIELIKYNETNPQKILEFIKRKKPKDIYYLAGQTSVGRSFQEPFVTYVSNISTIFSILDYCRVNKLAINIYNSASTECFGNQKKYSCNEHTEFNPVSPYGKSKSFSFWLTKYYREKFKNNSCSGILSNHESPLRGNNFVTQKIIKYVRNFNSRTKKKLVLGNINIYRDWGWAPEFVDAIYKINNLKKKNDFVIGTGETFSLEDFIKKAFNERNININFLIKNNKKFKRNREIYKIVCDINKIKRTINWNPKVKFNSIVKKLVNNELF